VIKKAEWLDKKRKEEVDEKRKQIAAAAKSGAKKGNDNKTRPQTAQQPAAAQSKAEAPQQ
jgi:hypothetical protein